MLTFRTNGENAITVFIDRDIVWIQQASDYLRSTIAADWDVIPSSNSITVITHQWQSANLQHCLTTLLHDFKQQGDKRDTSQHHTIPVCYHPSLGIDLSIVSELTNMSINGVIESHSQPTYSVEMLGFLPGFAYLKGLTPALHCQRKVTPRTQIPAGAVAIGGKRTGIYPLASPGGWQIIGATKFPLFTANLASPVTLKPLDTIQFQPISLDEYQQSGATTHEY